MCGVSSIVIGLNALTDKGEAYKWTVGEAFFASVGAQDFSRGEVEVKANIVPVRSSTYNVEVSVDGYVIVACDRCLEDMKQPVQAHARITVVRGYDAPDDDTISVQENAREVDISWRVYEMIALAIPISHVHEEGECDPEMEAKLNQFTIN